MKEVTGNIWDYYDQGGWIVITTNGVVKPNGELVMGKGIALEARKRVQDLPLLLGTMVTKFGNKVHYPTTRIISFPTKTDWRKSSDLHLVETSAKQLVAISEGLKKVYLPRPGCGNGHLNWSDVKPILEKYLDDRFIIVNRT